MSAWGRKEYSKAWPSRTPVWTWTATLLSLAFLVGMLTLKYEANWTAAERLYLADYLESGARGMVSATTASQYTLLEAVVGKGKRLVMDNEIEQVPSLDGRPGYRLTDSGVKNGIARLAWVKGTFNDRGLHRIMSAAVYDNVGSWDFYRIPVLLTAAFFVLALFLAVPKDRERRMIWKHGRRLRGPELVTTAEFNEKLGKSKLLTTRVPDGIALINEERSWIDKITHNDLSRWARVPRDREAMHFLIVGDSGTGKSAAIRQILSQVWERGEAAIVYDPAMEYLPQFYNEARGDVVLNPLDARCPFWTPGDEVPHEAEALTLAVSLFPDQGRENRFFVDAPRKIFAHLINLRPTPEELTHWMANADEIDKRIAGTEMAAMIEKGAANQRSGVLGSLNMVADAFKLLPRESETKQRWSTVEWAKERKGWVFLTSKPTMRERMRPLISLWLDLLVLRLMNEDSSTRKTWFVLDELASLQHLPQLKTAVTENRKSDNPMVLGFQGKAQVEALYGHVAEAMLSQPATIRGYSREYMEASSPRRQQIKDHLAEHGRTGPEAAEIAAHHTRGNKQNLSHDEVRAQHRAMATAHGDQPQRVVLAAAKRPAVELAPEGLLAAAANGMSYARERGMEREAVTDERSLMRDALKHTMGEARLLEIRAEFARRVEVSELIEVSHREGAAGRTFTTREMQGNERELIERMKLSQGNREVLADGNVRQRTMEQHPHLSLSQRNAVDTVLTSRDQMMALEGVAGAGKTTSLAAVREAAVSAGYEVEGLAPTSRAAQKLAEAGMETHTLQHHLARGDRPDDGQKRLYVIDESSMASTKQMHTFVERLKENDRVLFVGDTRQHEAVEAGRPYSQLQEAGLRTARLDEIIRQKDPALKEVVEQLARGEVRDAIGNLNEQGRVHEIGDRQERIAEIAREYVRSPVNTLVVSPDNESRREINQHIHRAMQDTGEVKGEEHRVHVLYARQDITGADRQYAQNYQSGDVIRYSKGSKPLGIEAGEYACVARTEPENNIVTVTRKSGVELSYDPRRLQGVTVYRDTERTFAEGDRVQLTAPYHKQKLANRELGTVEQIDGGGNLKLKMDSGREVEFNARQHPHLDYGYAVTSHSSQGQTADRVLIHVDSEQAHGELLNSRMAYVSVSRAQYDAQIYTNDAAALGQELSRDVSKSVALEDVTLAASVDPQSVQQIVEQLGLGLSL